MKILNKSVNVRKLNFRFQSANSFLQKSSPVFILFILIAYMAVANSNFFTASNFINIIKQSAVVGILAIGQTLVILAAGIDLSVGSIMALSGCVIAVASTQWGINPVVSVLLGIIVGIIVGFINGIIITKARLQDFIATLGILTASAGVALLVSDGLPISRIPDPLLVVGSGTFKSIPISVFVFIFIALMGWVVLNHTTLGRNILAIGGNAEAARTSGIKVEYTKILVYVISGFCSSIASIVMIGRLNSANALMGEGLELLSITAVALGGTSLAGGFGSISGTIIGIITIGVLSNGLDLLNITAFWQKVVLGLVIIAVVSLDTWRSKRVKK